MLIHFTPKSKSQVNKTSVDPGSQIQGQKDSGSASKNFSILTQKVVSTLSEIWSGLFIPDPDLDFLSILDPGSRGQKGTGSRIRISNTDINKGYVIFNKISMDRWEKGVMYSGRLSTAGLWINIWRRHKILSSSSDICEGTSRISIKTAYWVKDFASGSVPYPWYFRTDPNTDADPRIRTFN